jgi:hypothetical protein
LDRVGEIEEGAGIYAETKIEELLERKPRFDKPIRTRSTPYPVTSDRHRKISDFQCSYNSIGLLQHSSILGF